MAERLAESEGAFFVRSRRGPAEGFDVGEQGEQFADVLRASVATHVIVELDAFNVHGRRLADNVQKVLAGVHGHSVVVEQNHLQILLALRMRSSIRSKRRSTACTTKHPSVREHCR